MRDIQLFLERIADYPHALDHEQVTRPIKGAQPDNTKTGKGVKRPMEKELFGQIDVGAILADNPEYQQAWDMGLFDIGPTRPYGKSKDVQILHGGGLPDSCEGPNAYAQDEEFLQTGIVRINRKEENAGMSLDFDTELKCDIDGFINNGVNVVGSIGRKFDSDRGSDSKTEGFVRPGDVDRRLNKWFSKIAKRRHEKRKPRLIKHGVLPDRIRELPIEIQLDYIIKKLT